MDPKKRHTQTASVIRSGPPPVPDSRIREIHKRIARIDRRIQLLNRKYNCLEDAMHGSSAIGPYELVHLPQGLGDPGGYNTANAIDVQCISRLRILWKRHTRDPSRKRLSVLVKRLRRMRLFCRREVEAFMGKLIHQIQVLERVKDRLHLELDRLRQDRVITEVQPMPMSA